MAPVLWKGKKNYAIKQYIGGILKLGKLFTKEFSKGINNIYRKLGDREEPWS